MKRVRVRKVYYYCCETDLIRRFPFRVAKNFNAEPRRQSVAENDTSQSIHHSPSPFVHDRITMDQIRSSFRAIGARARVSRYFIRVHWRTTIRRAYKYLCQTILSEIRAP